MKQPRISVADDINMQNAILSTKKRVEEKMNEVVVDTLNLGEDYDDNMEGETNNGFEDIADEHDYSQDLENQRAAIEELTDYVEKSNEAKTTSSYEDVKALQEKVAAYELKLEKIEPLINVCDKMNSHISSIKSAVDNTISGFKGFFKTAHENLKGILSEAKTQFDIVKTSRDALNSQNPLRDSAEASYIAARKNGYNLRDAAINANEAMHAAATYAKADIEQEKAKLATLSGPAKFLQKINIMRAEASLKIQEFLGAGDPTYGDMAKNAAVVLNDAQDRAEKTIAKAKENLEEFKGNIDKAAKDLKEYAQEKGLELKNKAIDKAETAAIYAMYAGDAVAKGAKTVGKAVLGTGVLAAEAVAKGAATVAKETVQLGKDVVNKAKEGIDSAKEGIATIKDNALIASANALEKAAQTTRNHIRNSIDIEIQEPELEREEIDKEERED